ncbi:MAG: hypothetical protein ACKVPX_11420 [Myxococcaceae bacterium]
MGDVRGTGKAFVQAVYEEAFKNRGPTGRGVAIGALFAPFTAGASLVIGGAVGLLISRKDRLAQAAKAAVEGYRQGSTKGPDQP